MGAGQLTTGLVGAADRSIGRNQETNAGNLVCEALKYAATSSVVSIASSWRCSKHGRL